jgi:hypothetical protein
MPAHLVVMSPRGILSPQQRFLTGATLIFLSSNLLAVAAPDFTASGLSAMSDEDQGDETG